MLTVLAAALATVLAAVAAKLWGAVVTSLAVGASSYLAAISVDQTVIPVLIAVMSSGFVFGLFKIMPERRSILVQASENAVKVVNDAIGTLQKELSEARLEIARLETQLTASKEERVKFEKDIVILRERVIKLESQLEIYQRIRGEAKEETERRLTLLEDKEEQDG